MQMRVRNKFALFVTILILASALATRATMGVARDPLPDAAFKGFMTGFDLGAFLFLALSVPLLAIGDPAVIRGHAAENDANRVMLLVITGVISSAILGVVTMEILHGSAPGMKTKALIIGTLAVAWLFANTIYALHYAHLYYAAPEGGLKFQDKDPPAYADFVYFAFTLGMTFQTSDVDISDKRIRNVVTMHCLAAFVFNLGILAFTINVLGGS